MQERTKAHLALLGAALIYAANYSIAKIGLMSGLIGPLAFIFLRVCTGILVFWSLSFVIRERIERKDIPLLVLCGIFGVAINQMFFFMGLEKTTPVHASLLMTTTPILVLLISAIWLGERITWLKALGIFLGASGAVYLIQSATGDSTGQANWVGDLFVVINATSYGIYLVIVRSLMRKYNPLTVVKWSFSFAMILVFPFAIGEARQIQWTSFTTEVWFSVGFVLLFTTVMTYYLNAFALKRVQAATVSAYIYLQPLLASAISIAMAQEKLNLEKIISGFMILIGVYMVSKRKKIRNYQQID